MKKTKTLLGAIALAMLATTICACSKEKESSVVQQATGIEEVVSTPEVKLNDQQRNAIQDPSTNNTGNENMIHSCIFLSGDGQLVQSSD